MSILDSIKSKFGNLKLITGSKEKITKSKEKITRSKETFNSTKDDLKNLTIIGIIGDVIDNILLAFKYSLNDVTLMPGKHLKEPLQVCAGITLLSLLCSVFDIPFIIDWKGCTIGLFILGVLTYVGMKQDF